MVVLLLGVFAVATGAVVMLNNPVFSLWERRILAWAGGVSVSPLITGTVLVVLGLAGVTIGMRNLVNSVVEAIRPADVPDLVEHVYKARNLQRGLRIVTIGGGTGLSTMLRGLKEYTSNITAIVTVADDGEFGPHQGRSGHPASRRCAQHAGCPGGHGAAHGDALPVQVFLG